MAYESKRKNKHTKYPFFVIIFLAIFGVVSILSPLSADAATYTVNEGESIQDAINGATAGDIIEIAPGAYTERVVIDKQLTIRGAKAGQDARTRGQSGETIISAPNGQTEALRIAASGTVVDGLTITAENASTITDAIRLANPAQNVEVMNSIVKNGRYGIAASSVDVSGLRVHNNLFDSNNRIDQSQGIFINNGGSDIEVADNDFKNTYFDPSDGTSAIQISGTAATSMSNIRVLRNTSTNDGSLLVVFAASNIRVEGNTSTNQAGSAIYVGLNTSDLMITQNTLQDSARGIVFATDYPGTGITTPTANVSITENTITGMSEAAIVARQDAIEGNNIVLSQNRIFSNVAGVVNESGTTIVATNNWWGCSEGPGQPGCDTVNGSVDTADWLAVDPVTGEANEEQEQNGQQGVTEDGRIIPGVPNTGLL